MSARDVVYGRRGGRWATKDTAADDEARLVAWREQRDREEAARVECENQLSFFEPDDAA